MLRVPLQQRRTRILNLQTRWIDPLAFGPQFDAHSSPAAQIVQTTPRPNPTLLAAELPLNPILSPQALPHVEYSQEELSDDEEADDEPPLAANISEPIDSGEVLMADYLAQQADDDEQDIELLEMSHQSQNVKALIDDEDPDRANPGRYIRIIWNLPVSQRFVKLKYFAHYLTRTTSELRKTSSTSSTFRLSPSTPHLPFGASFITLAGVSYLILEIWIS